MPAVSWETVKQLACAATGNGKSRLHLPNPGQSPHESPLDHLIAPHHLLPASSRRNGSDTMPSMITRDHLGHDCTWASSGPRLMSSSIGVPGGMLAISGTPS